MDNEIDNAVLFLALDNGLNMDLIRLIAEEVIRPLPNDLQRDEQRARNENYYEETIPQYTNDLFIEHFRMSRASFEVSTSSFNTKPTDPHVYLFLP